ncbi:MAG: DUF1838 family protein [Cytophagales bacterium]|nr:DUF1838 family protein [Bernardetiaceae bacterium]MDW8205776.1 DUF1838 family protein [Cytophagales bacterium]
MKTIVLSILILVLVGRHAAAQNIAFNQDVFDKFVEMRVGDGKKPVYWYCYGEVYSYPDGTLLSRMEGIDAANLIRISKDSVIQLNRKIFVYTDAQTNQVLKEYNGQKVSHIEYPYQKITYVLKGDRMASYVEQGSGERITKIGPGYKTFARKMGDSYVFTAPVFLDWDTPRGKYEAYENYDFYYFPKKSKLQHRYQLSWVRYGDLPPFFGQGKKGIIQLVCYRVDDFEKIPDPIRSYIRNEAQLWLNPPKDLQEIAQLQQRK